MKHLRILALVSFSAGIALLGIGFLLRDGGSSPARSDTKTVEPTPFRATATNTPTATATNAPTATPTPMPFNGAVTRLRIPRFGVDSAIEGIGIKPNNELETPEDPLNTGWYTIYDKPGFGGNSVFSAHVDYYPNVIGPFNKLAQVALNDEIVVVMENGQEYKYRVISNQRYRADAIPMGEIIWPTTRPTDREWVTLITCGGEFVASRPGGPGEYLSRDVVVAERFQ